MHIKIEIAEVQHIQSMTFEIDLTENKLTCIVGKNGVGKTTLVKAIKNLAYADTFKKTSSDSIFREQSTIHYTVNDNRYSFSYEQSISSLNCKSAIPDSIKKSVDVELPLPHGERFDFFQTLSEADMEIRRAIVLESYSKPQELIDFMNEIYESNKFNDLVEINIKETKYYCITQPDNRYIREDYLSSGEYLLISLYRKINNHCRLIVIDEIDISLDAAAQVRLIRWLRECCTKFQVNILFTTHSLAMMRMLENNELNYMQIDQNNTEISPVSYNYIKSVMFGFTGWDKYILTEDIMLQEFLEFIIRKYCPSIFYKYHIIYIGTATSVADILQRNQTEEFFGKANQVIAILDGDMKDKEIGQMENTYCIPIESIERELYNQHLNGGVHERLTIVIPDEKQYKRVYRSLIDRRLMSKLEIFEYICNKNEEKMQQFAITLQDFLGNTQA